MSAKKKVTTKLVAKIKEPVAKTKLVAKAKVPVKKLNLVAMPKAPEKKLNPPTKAVEETVVKLSSEQRFNLIQEESYLMAEKDGFSKQADYYWHAAEIKLEAEKRI